MSSHPAFLAPRPPAADAVDLRTGWSPGVRHQAELRLVDVELDACDLAGVLAPGAQLRRCLLRGCRLTGAVLTDATLEDVRFVDCLLDVASFRAVRARRVSFESCRLPEAEFDEANIDFVRFERCDLTRASFAGTSCARVELRGCTLDGIRSLTGLRGAALPWDDLIALTPLLAAHLGLEVLDD